MAKQKKRHPAGSWEARFEYLKKETGLKGWQIYLISTLLFFIAFAAMLLSVMR